MASHPEQSFILQDAGHADTKHAPSKTWETNIRELAKNQNLSCKLSGLFTQGHRKTWKPADFYPFLEILFDAFGTERLLFASDWPFLLLSGIYVQWKSLLEKYTEKFFRKTGINFLEKMPGDLPSLKNYSINLNR